MLLLDLDEDLIGPLFVADIGFEGFFISGLNEPAVSLKESIP